MLGLTLAIVAHAQQARFTKWLGDIPIEGRCALCPETLFHAASPHHRPQKAEYTDRLQRAFDRHVEDCHREETPAPALVID
jgi:hypothetical protein